MFTQKIEQSKIDFIVAHMDDMPRAKLVRETGISACTAYRIIRQHGGKTDGWSKPRSKELDKNVIALYTDHSNPEIISLTGASLQQICRIRDKYALKKSDELVKKIKDKAMAKAHTPEVKAKAAKTWKRHHRYDEVLTLSGQKPLRNFKPRKWHNMDAYRAAWAQCKNNNYFMLDKPYVLYYDSETRRTKYEELLSNRHGLQFREADD